MKIVEKNVSKEEWNRFLTSNSGSTIYHTPEWKEFLEQTFDYDSKYLFAKNDNDELIGMIPFFRVNSKLTGNRLMSLPFSHICGPLGPIDVTTALIEHTQNIPQGKKSSVIEIRSFERIPGFDVNESFSTFILKLFPQVENIWNGLDRGSVRWAVKKSKNDGVTVEITNDIESLKEFYELNCLTKRDIGVPGHPWEYFHNLFTYVKPYVSLYSAKLNGKIIAGGIMERYNNCVIYGYGAANPDQLGVHPYHSFIWKSIEDACNEGYETYDFGRTSQDNIGLIQFKKRWGSQERKLYYNKYPSSRESSLINRDSIMYHIGNIVIKHMPLIIYKKFSKSSFSHFG
jgi:hypothetical protein